MTMRLASPFGETRPGWIVWQIDANGRSIVRSRHSWDALIFDSESEARDYGRMNVFDAYDVQFINTLDANNNR